MKQVPTDYAIVICRMAREQGIDLLEGLPITLAELEDRSYMALPEYLQILERNSEIQDETDWGFQQGQLLGMANHGPLGFGAVSAPTIRDGLFFLARYIPTRISYCSATVVQKPSAFHVVFRHDEIVRPHLRRMCETMSVVFQNYVETVGASAQPLVWRFPYEEPEHGDEYNKWLRGGYYFGAANLRLEVPRSIGMIPSAFRNDDVYKSTMSQCEAILAELSTDAFPEKVRNLLTTFVDRRVNETVPVTIIPSAEDVADQLKVSRRTLIRQLKQSGLTFQGLRDDIVRQHLEGLLVTTTLPIKDIGERLGYADAANLTRACKRMLGETPRRLRRAMANREPAG